MTKRRRRSPLQARATTTAPPATHFTVSVGDTPAPAGRSVAGETQYTRPSSP
ncbi:MAG: hypothetical protein HY907_13610 [Deltaproteobacteria bacterium]|nr:hypothetical protein [Deltaproteobacteria bacterium]